MQILELLVDLCEGDLRRCINTLQSACRMASPEKGITQEDVLDVLGVLFSTLSFSSFRFSPFHSISETSRGSWSFDWYPFVSPHKTYMPYFFYDVVKCVSRFLSCYFCCCCCFFNKRLCQLRWLTNFSEHVSRNRLLDCKKCVKRYVDSVIVVSKPYVRFVLSSTRFLSDYFFLIM